MLSRKRHRSAARGYTRARCLKIGVRSWLCYKNDRANLTFFLIDMDMKMIILNFNLRGKPD